jgi:hypothetical protein
MVYRWLVLSLATRSKKLSEVVHYCMQGSFRFQPAAPALKSRRFGPACQSCQPITGCSGPDCCHYDMPQFTFPNAPSRNQLLDGEKERDELALRLQTLEAKIKAGRAARVPPLNDDVLSSVLDYFRLPVTDPEDSKVRPSTLSLRRFGCVSK